jgi:hypothetical protein
VVGGWRGNAPGRATFWAAPKCPRLLGRSTHTITPHSKKGCLALPHTFSPLCLSLSLPYKSSHTNPRLQATQRAQLVSTSLLLCIATQHKSLSLSTALSLFSASPALRTRFFASFSRCKRLLKLLLHRDKCCACARGSFDSAPSPFSRVRPLGHAPCKRTS